SRALCFARQSRRATRRSPMRSLGSPARSIRFRRHSPRSRSTASARTTVHEWTILHRAGNDLAVRITCGGGTYIRALARDLGRLSGSAAHLAALRRTRSGPFDVSSATTLDDIDRGQITLAPLGDAIPAMPRRTIDAAELTRVLHGNSIDARGESGRVALVDHDHSLIAIAERENDVLRPKLVLHDA